MTTSLTIVLENRPGALADMAEAMGRAAVNIEGVCCFVSEGIAIAHVAVEHPREARRELENLGLRVFEERPVALVPIEDHPGAAAQVLRSLAHAGINIDMAYLASNTRMVIGSSDLEAVQALLG